MPPRLRLRLRPSQFLVSPAYTPALQRCAFASVATATTPAPAIDTVVHAPATIHRHANTQPPSYKPPEFRKSQLHRQYTSLLRSSPLILVFQHNNIKANEWMAIRRELTHALRKVDEDIQKANPEGESVSYADTIKIQIVQTGIFGAALKIVEFYKPEGAEATELSHGLSKAAYVAANSKNLKHELDPLMSGPLAILSFPAVSPQHLKAALSILSPSPEFPAPKRRARPAYHDPAVQGGLQKLMLLASRVEGKVFDQAGIKWIGGIDGGLDGLRAQLVHMLQSLGASVTNTLEGASKSLYFTMESRKGQLEEEQTPTEKSS